MYAFLNNSGSSQRPVMAVTGGTPEEPGRRFHFSAGKNKGTCRTQIVGKITEKF
jgi:hypothetical protein